MSCPIKSGKEFKLLQSQLGSEEAAIYVWKALGEDYPSTLMSTSDLKKELGIKTKMSNDQIVALAKEVKRYNKFNSTSHSFSYTQFADTTDYLVSLNISYLPVKREITRLELFEQNPTWTNMPVDIRKSAHLEGLPELGTDFFMGDQALRDQTLREQETDSLFGLETKDRNVLEFHVNTLNVVSQFLEKAGVQTRFVPTFLAQDGTVVEGAIAAANFIQGTVDIIDDVNKRPDAWNKLPEEAAHWWYRLLDQNSPLKDALLQSAKTTHKEVDLRNSLYGKTEGAQVISRIDLDTGKYILSPIREEAIGQLIAEAIERIQNERGSPADYSFFKAFLEWINKLLSAVKAGTSKGLNQDPFEVAAMKILSSDMTELMSWNEYNTLNNAVNFTNILTEQSAAPLDYTLINDFVLLEENGLRILDIKSPFYEPEFDSEPLYFNSDEERDAFVYKTYGAIHDKRQQMRVQEVRDNQAFFDRLLNKTFRKRTRFLSKTLNKYYRINTGASLKRLSPWSVNESEAGKVTKKLTDTEKKLIVDSNQYTNITPTLKVLPEVLKKYKTQLIALGEPIKIDAAKKQELAILNGIKDLIKSENPNKKTITAEEFVNEVHHWLETNYLLGFANETKFASYRIDQTFKNVPDRVSDTDFDMGQLEEDLEEGLVPLHQQQNLREQLGLNKQNPAVYHNKISLRFNDTYHLKKGHFELAPSAWGNLTYFYTGNSNNKDAVLLHEIQNDNIETLREFDVDKQKLDKSIGYYLHELNETLIGNIKTIESGDKEIETFINPGDYITKGYRFLNSKLEEIVTMQPMNAYYRFRERVQEEVDLYEGNLHVYNLTKAQDAVDREYIAKQRWQDFLKRGGLKSVLSKEDLDSLQALLQAMNTGTILQGGGYSEEENQYEPPQQTVRSLGDKKRAFAEFSSRFSKKINDAYEALYGTKIYFQLSAPAKALPKSQRSTRVITTRTGEQTIGNASQNLNESINFLILFNEKRELSKRSEEIGNAKRNYSEMRNLTQQYIFNRSLSKISNDQFTTLVENFEFNKKLREKLVYEQALKQMTSLSDTQVSESRLLNKIENQQDTFEALKEMALEKKAEIESKYEKLQEEVKDILEIEMNYFTPLIHHLIQKHIKEHGKDFPMYFSGYEITKLTQGNTKTALIYAGKDEVKFTKEEADLIKYKAALKLDLIDELPFYEEPSKSDIEAAIKKLSEYKKKDKWHLDSVVYALMELSGGRPLETGALYNAMSQVSGVKLIWQDHIQGMQGEPGGYRVDLSNYNYVSPILYGLQTTPSTQTVTVENPATVLYGIEPSLTDVVVQENPQFLLTEEMSDNTRAREIAAKLSDQLGVEYEIISEEQAREITTKAHMGDKSALTPWNGEAAFFIGGKVYFIGSLLTTNTALHEFSHPLVRAISKENKAFFDNLYKGVKETAEGRAIIQEVARLYPNLKETDPLFKEEVIVRAIEKQGTSQFKTSTGFAKWINDILYAIKQMLRRRFGQKADVSKLNPNTTLEELTTMLVEGQKFIINTEVITDEDLIAYSRQRASELDDMNNLSNTDAQDLANAAYTTFSKNVKALKDNNQYDDLAVILKDQFKRSDLEQMKGDLAKYQTVIADVSNRVVRDLEYKTNQVTALLNVMGRLENVVEKMDAHLADIANSPETLDNLNKAYYYKDFIDSWEGFIEIAKAVLNDKKNNVPKNSPVLALVNSISTSLDRSKDTINDIYAESAKDALYTELEPMGRTIKARYDDIIKELKAKKAPQKDIDRWHKEFYGLTEADYNTMKQYEANKNNLSAEQKRIYENMRIENAKGLEISKTKIESLLKGQAGDANYFNSYLEGYLYNSDPIIGGLALYVKNKLNEVMAISQAKFNDFNIDVEPYFKAAGVNENNIGELGTRIGFLDSVGRIVKAGEKGKENLEGTLEERKVWTLLSKFKGYRYAFDQLDHAVKLAQKAWGDSGSDTDRTLLIQAVANRAKESRAWMHQKYDDRYNKLDEIFEYDPPGEEGVGEEAIYRRDNALENINLLSGKSRNQSDELAMADQLDDLWAKYKQLYSLFNPDGTAKTGFERNVALRILRYQQESRDFHTFEPREGVFQNALRAYEQELIDDGNTVGDDVYNDRRTEWIKRNTRVKIKDEFYVRREEILDEIKEILSTLRDGDDIDMGILWEEVFKRTGEFRDDDGQLKGDQMSEITIAEVKALQEEMIVKQNNYKSRSGLTPNEQFELEELRRLKKQGPLSPTDKARMNVLFNALNTMGLSEAQSKRLDTLYEDLGELSRTEPTEYYVEKINSFLQNLNTDKVEAKIKSRLTSIGNVDKALTDSVLEDLFAQSPEFETWFKDNHIRKSVYNEKTRRKEPTWVRLYVWNITKPQDSSMLEVTEIKDENGVVTDIIEGVPNSKYFKRTVKPEYLTKEILGVTKDNKGNWLPKDIPGSPFLNEKYAALNAADKALLEKLTEHHLRNQEGLDRNSKLYLDFPRFSKSNLEVLQTQSVGKDKMTALTIWAQRFRNFFRDSAADNPQKGMNEDDKFNLVKVDMFDNNVTGVPIAGLYDMEYADVTTDIRHSMMRYMLSAERQKQLIAISPVVRAIQSVVKDPRNAVLPTTIDKRNFVGRTIEVFRGKKDKSIRAKAVDNFIEREFEGKALAGHTKDMAWVNNLQNKLFARASFGFFALNIPSALKNSFSAKFQGMIEASAGTYMNHKTFAQGEVDSIKTMTEISAQVYEHGPKSLHVQLVELMDPSQGRFEDKFGESGTRTLLKDTASMTWLYNFRKWTELQATLQTFFGMMHHKNDIEQTQPDGTVKKLDYVDVWEIKDGKIQLKPGIDPKWGITYDAMGVMNVGSEYKLMRNKIHQTMNNLQGSYAQFDQPEAQRYLGFRFLSFLKKYFVPMATNRWGFAGKWSDPRPRLNPGMADAQMGYYITFLKTLERTIKSLGQNLPSMTKPEKAAALKVLTETMALLVATLLMSLLFGWDPDDEDRFKKMRAKSGPLPFFPFTADDPTRPFNGWGFLENHALLLMMNVRAENESFLPFPGFGLEKYAEMMDLKSIAFQPTIKNYIAILRDMINIASRNDDAYYERAVGPYKWQQEGGTKMWAHFAQIAGMTGSTLEPFKGVKGIETTSKFR